MRTQHTKLRLMVLSVSMALAPAALASTTWYVNGTTGNDSNNCLTPTTACATIGGAISRTASSDSVVIAAGTYSENLLINLSLNLRGAGAGKTMIDGGSHSTDGGGGRVLEISTTTARVSLSSLTIQNGIANSGGGISNSGVLSINNSSFVGNTATNESTAAGGAIYNLGTVTINKTTFNGNTVNARSAYGGAVYNSGSLTITSSTLYGNSATGLFGGWGGGVINYGKTWISSSTFSGNSAATGGGIYNSTTATIQNSIIANSVGGNCSGTMSSNGYNLSSDGTCNFSHSGDLNNTNPKLGALKNNGGPTDTMALPSGSPAIDAGNPAGCTDSHAHLLTTDQRGQPRPDKEDTGGCDIGAYESQTD